MLKYTGQKIIIEHKLELLKRMHFQQVTVHTKKGSRIKKFQERKNRHNHIYANILRQISI